MDNITRFYRSRYETAQKYAHEGERQKCLDICWELRLAPDLSLYRRACVNLLIATVVDVRTHPDCDKFANECIALVEQIKRESHPSQESLEGLDYLESHARTTLVQIRELQFQMQLDAAAAENPLEGFEEVPLEDEDKQLLNELAGIGSDEVDKSAAVKDEPDKPWTIEDGDRMDTDTAESAMAKQKIWSDQEALSSATATSFSELPLRLRERERSSNRSTPTSPEDKV